MFELLDLDVCGLVSRAKPAMVNCNGNTFVACLGQQFQTVFGVVVRKAVCVVADYHGNAVCCFDELIAFMVIE